MKHVMIIDPLEKLVTEKDTTIQLCVTMKNMGMEVYTVEEKDIWIDTSGETIWPVKDFEGRLREDQAYIESFKITCLHDLKIDHQTCIHMRLDPPFDTRYLKVLWLLRVLKKRGVKVLNDPDGILLNNEKLLALQHPTSISTYLGVGDHKLVQHLEDLRKKGAKAIIVKPLDLYQGFGVEKISLEMSNEQILKHFIKNCTQGKDHWLVQPFLERVSSGEVRSIYFKGKELGSILKVPQKGKFLANIAQGATYSKHTLSKEERSTCEKVSQELGGIGVDWLAFDLLDGHLSEVNITCPGLLVEVSKAYGQNLSKVIATELSTL